MRSKSVNLRVSGEKAKKSAVHRAWSADGFVDRCFPLRNIQKSSIVKQQDWTKKCRKNNIIRTIQRRTDVECKLKHANPPLMYSKKLMRTSQAHAEVLELTSTDFDSKVSSGKWLIEFYAPWCGYCRRLEPIYNDVGSALQNSDVKVAKVDAAQHKVLGHRFAIKGFPTIIHVNDGVIRNYEGDRSKDALVSYAISDWQKDDPAFSPLFSPLGFLGRIFGVILDFLVYFQEGYERLRVAAGVSHPIALGALSVSVIVLGLVIGTILTVILTLLFPDRGPAADPKKSN